MNLARFSAPFCTLGLVSLLILHIRNLLLARALEAQYHTVLCGLGEAGWYFVSGWLAEGRAPTNLIVIEAEDNSPRVDACRSRGIPVIVGMRARS